MSPAFEFKLANWILLSEVFETKIAFEHLVATFKVSDATAAELLAILGTREPSTQTISTRLLAFSRTVISINMAFCSSSSLLAKPKLVSHSDARTSFLAVTARSEERRVGKE